MSDIAQNQDSYLGAPYGLAAWLLTKDHKRIAMLYLISITLFFAVGGMFAGAIRLELLTPKGDLWTPDLYNKLFTLHGVVMIFFFLIPSIPAVLGNFLLPIMIGSRKLPIVAGIDGMRKKKIITTPCSVKSLLYMSSENRSPFGVSSSSRTPAAKRPPIAKKIVIEMRYSIAIRLWSSVRSHAASPYGASR